MIDYEYKISISEVSTTLLNARRFVAELSQIYLLVNGERMKVDYPKTQFYGHSQTVAMLQANEAFYHWLKTLEPAALIKHETCEVLTP